MIETPQEGMGKSENVIPAFPERRYRQLDGAQPVVEILPKGTLLHFFFQVEIRRRNDPHIHTSVLEPADTPEDGFLYEPQEFWLKLIR
jgi:hypothetical protein